MRSPFFLLALTALSVQLAGCDKAPAPTAAARPQLARPVFTLAANASDRIAIPRAALTVRGGISMVLVVNEQGEARERMVRPGHRLNGRIEILAGLKGNERLVLGDLTEVRDGSPIQTVKNSK